MRSLLRSWRGWWGERLGVAGSRVRIGLCCPSGHTGRTWPGALFTSQERVAVRELAKQIEARHAVERGVVSVENYAVPGGPGCQQQSQRR